VDINVEKMLAKVGITGMVAAVLMIIFGILVIAFQALIAWIIGLYLIVVGLVNLIGHISPKK
jgi:uncharacterized membrane protein HdeD (DUF308 family)